MELEGEYPYTAKNGTCQYVASKGLGQVKTYNDIGHTAEQLVAAIAKQPTSVGTQANQPAFQHYKTGVITSECRAQLDHGVLAVGYGTTEQNVDYFRVKNSWGLTAVSHGGHGDKLGAKQDTLRAEETTNVESFRALLNLLSEINTSKFIKKIL